VRSQAVVKARHEIDEFIVLPYDRMLTLPPTTSEDGGQPEIPRNRSRLGPISDIRLGVSAAVNGSSQILVSWVPLKILSKRSGNICTVRAGEEDLETVASLL
jgi:hypothetical protein